MPDGLSATEGLDDELLAPTRLAVLAALPRERERDSAHLAALVELTASELSDVLAHLERVGYVRVRRGTLGVRPRRWVRSTGVGRRAYEIHVRALHAIVARGPAAS